jgi:hypothetical protein
VPESVDLQIFHGERFAGEFNICAEFGGIRWSLSIAALGMVALLQLGYR